MPEWLTSPVPSEGDLTFDQLALRLVSALVLGLGVAAIYRLSHGRERDSSPVLTTTLVLLAVLIAMVTLTIGNSVARAFSLVGALSIVRFRTVVEDTRDTAFVIFAVIVGMSAGAGLLIVPLIGLPVVGTAAMALSYWPRSSKDGTETPRIEMNVRLGLGRDPQLVLAPAFEQCVRECRLLSAATARQGAALDLKYSAQLLTASTVAELVTRLNQIEGVLAADAAIL